jgi:hypothetical protein
MCDELAVSGEHVPPKCIFPEQKDLPSGQDLRVNLLKVPSCKEHNNSKSSDDHYLLCVLAMNLPANEVAKDHFLSKIQRSILRDKELLSRYFPKKVDVVVVNEETGKSESSLALAIDDKKFDTSIDMLSRALYFSHFKKKYLEGVSVRPDFLLTMDDVGRNKEIHTMSKAYDSFFQDKPFFGENPSVFKYQVYEADDDRCDSIFRLYFYGSGKITVYFGLKK